MFIDLKSWRLTYSEFILIPPEGTLLQIQRFMMWAATWASYCTFSLLDKLGQVAELAFPVALS